MKATKGSVWLEGPVLTKHNTGQQDAYWPENQPFLQKLIRGYRVRKSTDGWFVDGGRGQLWEAGIGLIGFTVGTGYAINAAISAGFTPTQRGDGEANFGRIPWTVENIARIASLLCLKKRRTMSASTETPFYNSPLLDTPETCKKSL